MAEESKTQRFEALMLPHLDAAWNLARWLTRNDHDAEDVVQEAFLRAFRFFDGFHGAQSRPWLLAIVRNTAYSWMEKNRTGKRAARRGRLARRRGRNRPGNPGHARRRAPARERRRSRACRPNTAK